MLFCASTSHAQTPSPLTVSGFVFGDYFYKLGGGINSGSATAQYAPNAKDDQAFQFRRIYLFADYTFNESFSSQLLLESNDRTLDPGGRNGIFVKTAFVEWKELLPMSTFSFGLIPAPTWALFSERIWAYRPIEKTITDFRGLGVATDLGISLRGKFTAGGILSYTVMAGNGNGPKPETDKHKKFYGSLQAKLPNGLVFEAYGDYEPVDSDRNRTTMKGLAAYQRENITIGIEAVQQVQKKLSLLGEDQTPFGISLYAWAPVPGTTNLNAFARFDYYDPDTKISSAGFTENFYTAGFDYMPVKNIHIMPNLWMNAYAAKASGAESPDADVVVRGTFFFVFK